MQIILRPRQMGKTTELIRMSAETFAYIIVRSKNDATRIFHQAKEVGLDIPFPLTFQEFISGEYFGKNIKGFLIDNADDLLQSLSKGVPVQAISVTGSHLTLHAPDGFESEPKCLCPSDGIYPGCPVHGSRRR